MEMTDTLWPTRVDQLPPADRTTILEIFSALAPGVEAVAKRAADVWPELDQWFCSIEALPSVTGYSDFFEKQKFNRFESILYAYTIMQCSLRAVEQQSSRASSSR